jgi:glyoxylase-like metal-dependent hydrolase (beta-lactamase superfamily II)/rhodanese-related sulfurtransferase
MRGFNAIEPLVDEGLGNSSYLVDLGDGRALVIDPVRNPAPYERIAGSRHLTIAFTAETHLHADFVSGSCELASSGAEVIASAAGGRDFGHRGVRDGDEVDLGGLRLRAMATPGHTAEHMAYVLLDGDTPRALFTGGSLLVGSVARTDLVAAERTEALARAMYHSLHDHILTLPDDVAVYPTHGAGSFCAAPAGGERITTIGRERANNPLLAAPDEDTFVQMLTASLGSYPSYFARLAEVNRRGPRVYGRTPPLAQLSVDEVRKLARDGAELIDVRRGARFAEGHIPGAISIELRPAFATWLGWLAADDRPLVFIADDDQDREDLVAQTLKVGYESIAGELHGGMAAWRAAGGDEVGLSVIPAEDVVPGNVVDVRQASEYASGHMPGATPAELGSLLQAAIPDGDVTVMCAHGQRAMSAASLLQRAGHRGVSVASGGPEDWVRAGRGTLTSGD